MMCSGYETGLGVYSSPFHKSGRLAGRQRSVTFGDQVWLSSSVQLKLTDTRATLESVNTFSVTESDRD